ncbi:AMP-dependent synthetase/ligase [Flammeovirga pacifica]|uniref:Long-chain fatty acid--CoA ligase n=1 Tax=Flammeovirga pacifica TaxID=915059 RepID=A0A1S1YT76_FLAPC|nr:long-chain fatty acid--CoA ligase [Flammeovirga pacifica]OHX64206.1 long-chain fatty acid--CoA ligase [Flammeovirga pacifica]
MSHTSHLVHNLRNQVQKQGNKDAARFRVADNLWESISWTDFGHEIDLVSKSLLANGIGVQDKVGIYAQNMPFWTVADFATQQIRGVAVSIYATSTSHQAAYIINDAQIKVLFVGDQEQYDNAIEVFDRCESLTTIVAMKKELHLRHHKAGIHWIDFTEQGGKAEKEEMMQRIEDANMEDLVTLIYTSGTTGEPKGVMLDYVNFISQFEAHSELVDFTEKDVNLSFLPLSHVFERTWSMYVFYNGATNCYLEDVKLIKEALVEAKPHVMCAVPRFYEKIFSAIHDKVAKASPSKKKLFHWAVGMGKKAFDAKQEGKTLGGFDKMKFNLATKLVLGKFQKLLGGNIKFMPAGGAKLDPEIGAFFHSIGIPIILGYGLTETNATVSAWHINQKFYTETIGTTMPGCEIKIDDKTGEILVKSKVVMKGYYNKPEETAKSFDENGFFKTGDKGEFDEKGNLLITDRIKELMKTSNGKYIAPQLVEGKIGKDHFVEQIATIADARNFVSALIVPTFETLEVYAQENDIAYSSKEDLIKNSQIIRMYEARIEKAQHDLANFEKVKKFTLLSKEFSQELGEMTPTLKLKRKVINKNYEAEINEMYSVAHK